MKRKARSHRMPERFEVLAVYNAEVARGVEHSPGWKVQMWDLQADFDRWSAETFGASETAPVPPMPQAPPLVVVAGPNVIVDGVLVATVVNVPARSEAE